MALTVNAVSYYSINAPGVIKSNRKYTVFTALHEASGPCSIRIAIEGPNFNEFQDITLQPYETKVIDFFPKKLLHGDYKLKAEGLNGLSFTNQSNLIAYPDYGPKIYIQSDKAIYKPQDVVNFRIVILDEHTRPLNIEDPIDVEIFDSAENRVKLFSHISLTSGVYTGQFKLSKYPLLGRWKIKAVLGGKYDYSNYKYIKILDYTLPKFSVYLKTPSNIVLEDGYIKVVIFGKYTFDKHVEGNATIELWNNYDSMLLQTKQIEIESLGFVEFDIKDEKRINKAYSLEIKAKLTDKYSGRTEEENKTIYLQRQRYNLLIPYDEIEFENNKPYRLNVYVKHWTGAAVLDHSTPVTMEHGSKIYESFLDENGVATFEFDHEPNAKHTFLFKDSKEMLYNIYTSANLMLNNREFYCRLKLVGGKLKLGKPVQIEVSSIVNIPYLMYTIMGHASLIRTEYIKVPPNQKSHIITITPTIEMIPKSFIYVYYVHKGNLRYEEMRLSFPYEFENQISLSAPKQAKPGEVITIDLKAQPDSYVSILAVDLGVYLLDNTYDLNRGEILSHLDYEVSYTPIAATLYPGLTSGLLTLTNAHYPFENIPGKNETDTKLTFQIPDVITTWRITAFSNHAITGFGIVNGPTDITTILPFFISLNLPNSIKRGEILNIPITIFNYSNQTLDTTVVLYNSDKEFYFMESAIQGPEKSNENEQQNKLVTVPADKAKTLNFLIYPIKTGEISLRVSASSSSYSDAVLKKLLVEPEGVPKQLKQALYLSIPKGEKISSTFIIEEPEFSVPDSDCITFSVGGHYLVPTVENFNNLIQLPTGTGEQNMVNFAPGILILQYLKLNDKLSSDKDLVKNLRSSIDIGYQQQLSFRHENGGYSVFGMDTDEEPNTWLTAYVVRYFIKGLEFLSIETKIIESALEYLSKQQKPNGEFRYTGYLIKPNHKNEYGLTAFILLAFLENQKNATQYTKIIENGVEFLNSNLNNINDIYTISLTATIFQRVKHPSAKALVEQLKSHAKEKDGLKWWSANDQNLSNDIEITAYAALALLDNPGDHSTILRWLIEQRNINGGFKSSYDTVVGMEALVKFSELYKNLNNINLKISYSAKDLQGSELFTNAFHVNANNILDFQEHELPKNTRHITFEMEGTGTSLIQLKQQYNIVNTKEFRHFNIQPKAIHKNEGEINVEICFTYQADANMPNVASNLVIMEANLPSGFKSEPEKSIPLKENKLVQRIESKNSESTVILYLDKLEPNKNHCLTIPADKTSEILMPRPVAILMYDYYNLSRSNIEFYSL
ncbi:hypothetical protein FF38_00366 [Lucilia cuprina]|uniref:TEP1-F n=1 Tax=Lucilia cuprina TaxID=7375 RepID=A0A0L0BS67_LUCCU|nr:hypothetical protein FF38_00366 [Lucilia cuprina]